MNNIKQLRYKLNPKGNSIWLEKKTVITSGSLMSVAAFNVVGPFREDFFIDHIDHEYCLRARAKGFKVILALKPLMRHSIGASTKRRIVGFTIETSNHSPLRYYYKSRNHVLLMRDYFFMEPGWNIKLLTCKVRAILLVCLFEKQRFTKLRNIVKGYYHGIIGVTT